ncbi:uncharacterized protein FOMMEDRAFT_24209, partial [Fomitiporia mediterranea MF3/22]
MCNAHFQHYFDDTSASISSGSSYPARVDVSTQQQQQNSRGQLTMPPHHDASTGTHGHDSSVPSLSPVSASGWSYPLDAQSDLQMYSPTSSASYSGFHSPIDSNPRPYALAGALQQQQNQQQQQQSNAAYPESSQRSTELARGGHGHGHGQAPSPYFPEAQQRWGYAPGHAHAAHDFAQDAAAAAALSMSRGPIMDHPQVQAPSASDDVSHSNHGHARIPPAFATGNVPGDGGRVSMSAGPGPGPGAAGDQRAQSATRQLHQGVSLNGRAFPQLQHNHHHRDMSSQQSQQQQQWLPQGHSQQLGDANAPFLQMPTPRSVNAPQQTGMRNFFPYDSRGAGGMIEYDMESDDFDHEEFDDGFEEDDGPGSAGHNLHFGIPPPASPTPELQFPQHVSGTPSDLMRTNFMLYGADPANWPMDSLGGLAGGSGMNSLMEAGGGPGSVHPGSASPRSMGGSSKGKKVPNM